VYRSLLWALRRMAYRALRSSGWLCSRPSRSFLRFLS